VIKLYGDLAQIIAFSETATGKQKDPVSAEAGQYCRWLRGEDLNL